MRNLIKIMLCTSFFLVSITAAYGQKSRVKKERHITDTVRTVSDTMKSENEEVGVGYGEIRKREITGPVDKIDGQKLKNAHYDNIYEMIRGKAAGVEVNGTSIRIRNATSLGAGSEPLLVVDGVPVNTISNIDPDMVRSIEVLKGAAASIYGSRGGNGVILINLKKGKE